MVRAEWTEKSGGGKKKGKEEEAKWEETRERLNSLLHPPRSRPGYQEGRKGTSPEALAQHLVWVFLSTQAQWERPILVGGTLRARSLDPAWPSSLRALGTQPALRLFTETGENRLYRITRKANCGKHPPG